MLATIVRHGTARDTHPDGRQQSARAGRTVHVRSGADRLSPARARVGWLGGWGEVAEGDGRGLELSFLTHGGIDASG